MNVLHITTSTSGGAGVACIRLHQGLLKTFVSSSVLCLKDYKKVGSAVPHIHEFSDNFVKTIIRKSKFWIYEQKLKASLRNQSPGFESFSLVDTLFDITEHPQYKKADIIHLHWVSGFMDFPSFFQKNTKPVAWTLHDMFPFTGGCHHADDCDRFMTDCNSCPQLRGCRDEQLALKQLSAKKKAISDAYPLTVVTPSRWLKDLSVKSSLFKKFSHYHLPNGIDENIFSPGDKQEARIKLNLPLDKKIILFVAHSVANYRKGSHLLLEAATRLKTENAGLVAVGKTKGLHDSLPFISLGEINSQELMALAYRAADLFVLPSLAENLPNTIAESLLCGTPAIGFPVGGIPEMIKEKTGILCREINATNLAATIDHFFEESDKFDAKEIRKVAVENYSLGKQAEAYNILYNSILNQLKS